MKTGRRQPTENSQNNKSSGRICAERSGHSASTGERKTATVLFSGAVSFGTAAYIRGGVTTIRVMATAFLDRGRAQWTVPAELKDVCCTQCSVRKISVLASDVE